LAGDPQGTIDLRHAFSIAECDWDTTSSEDGDSAAASFGISIVCVVEDASRVWDLFAEDEHERSSWMAVLRPIVAENRIPQFGLRRSGWAVRQGGIFNGWSKRWLVLGHDSIALFRSQQRGTKYAALAPLEYRHTPKALLADASIGTMELFGCTVRTVKSIFSPSCMLSIRLACCIPASSFSDSSDCLSVHSFCYFRYKKSACMVGSSILSSSSNLTGADFLSHVRLSLFAKALLFLSPCRCLTPPMFSCPACDCQPTCTSS
jgi:hypothetical protein